MTAVSDRIADGALRRGIRICVAESLTCGLLAAELGKGHDAADWFAGGVIAYRTDVKVAVLGVASGLDPCSAPCAEQLADGVKALLDADVAVSATGVGGPDPEDGHAPGTVYLGWSDDSKTGHRRLALTGSPAQILEGTIEAALELLEELMARHGPSVR